MNIPSIHIKDFNFKNIPAIVTKIAALLAVIILSVYFYPTSNRNIHYYFQEGKPWNYDLIVADEDFPIYKTDEQLDQEREEITNEFVPYFYFSGKEGDKYIISAEDWKDIKEHQYKAIHIVDARHMSTLISVQDIVTPKKYFQETNEERNPNLSYDYETTENMQESILSGIALTEGMVQRGEKIIDRGEIVTSEIRQILISYLKDIESNRMTKLNAAWSYVGLTLMIIIIIGLFALYLIIFRHRIWEETQAILLFSLVMSIIIIGSFLILQNSDAQYLYLVPFAWVPIIARVFYDSRTAMMLHITTVTVVSLAAPIPYQFIIEQMLVGIVTVCALKDMSQRAQLASTAGYILLTLSVTHICFQLTMTGVMDYGNWMDYVYFAINALLVICVYGLIYLLEKLFHLVSSMTLIELANVNSNLMHDFAEKAPGTFHHSLQVSNLASEAAKAIGAKVLLVRTGALYHDIGKMLHPEYFTENQMDNINPLKQMGNKEAANAIIHHVLDGEKLARQRHLPEVIIHFINSHHGNSLVRYFYNSEVNEKGAENVDEKVFRYPCPKPRSKEAAILMMADAVEARSRSLTVYTEESISAMVEDMVGLQAHDGQFAETPLSFRDLERVKKCFKERLISMNHHRIAYPDIQHE